MLKTTKERIIVNVYKTQFMPVSWWLLTLYCAGIGFRGGCGLFKVIQTTLIIKGLSNMLH